jgi:radical SAM protein with 4Fe4S-binding SPASM domain
MPVERFFVPTGRGLENRKKFLESDSVLPIIIPKLLGEYCKESLHGRKQSENFNGLNKISACSCDAGIKKFFINYNADIYPCQSLIKEEYRIGNVFDNDIKYKLLNFENTCCGKKIEMIQPYNLKHCKNCDVNIFCWNCPAMIDSVKENEIEIKNWCELMKEKLNHLVWKI